MSKYENKRFHISAFDVIISVFFFTFLCISGFFWSDYQATKGKFNIRKSKVDFIILAPSVEQISEIQSRDDVDRVVPYVFRTIDINENGKTVNSGIYVIDDKADLNYTVFCDELKVKSVEIFVSNPLYISADLARKAGVSVNDKVSTSISGRNIEFTVVGIYKSDNRNVGGTAMTFMQDDIKSLCGENYKYNGAYVSSNDIKATGAYLDNYIGLGDLRSADEFESDAAYQLYLENRNNKNSDKSTFNRSDYLKELDRRYEKSLYRQLILSLFSIVFGFFVLFSGIFLKSMRYTKKNVEKDVRDNFTLKQERRMYSRYHTEGAFLHLIACFLYLIVSYFVFQNELISIHTIIVFVMLLFSTIFVRSISLSNLNRRFSLYVEK